VEPHGHRVGVDRVVYGLAAMDRVHREHGPEANSAPFLSTQVREPGPGEEAFDGHDHLCPRGRDGLEKRLRTGVPVPVQHDRASRVQDTDVHAAGVTVNATIRLMLFGVKSPEVSSSCASSPFPSASIPPWDAEGEASISLKGLERTR
jgi:hypothetical protein